MNKRKLNDEYASSDYEDAWYSVETPLLPVERIEQAMKGDIVLGERNEQWSTDRKNTWERIHRIQDRLKVALKDAGLSFHTQITQDAGANFRIYIKLDEQERNSKRRTLFKETLKKFHRDNYDDMLMFRAYSEEGKQWRPVDMEYHKNLSWLTASEFSEDPEEYAKKYYDYVRPVISPDYPRGNLVFSRGPIPGNEDALGTMNMASGDLTLNIDRIGHFRTKNNKISAAQMRGTIVHELAHRQEIPISHLRSIHAPHGEQFRAIHGEAAANKALGRFTVEHKAFHGKRAWFPNKEPLKTDDEETDYEDEDE